jgi:hypothetical protein
MLKWLLKSLFILVALVVVSATLPFTSVWLCRDRVGGQVFFWVAPYGRCSSRCLSARAFGWVGSTCSRGVPPEAAI